MFNTLPLVSCGFRAILYVSPLYVRFWCPPLNYASKWLIFTNIVSVMPLESHFLISYTMEDKTTIEERLPSVQQSQSHAATTSSQSGSPSSCTAHLGAHVEIFSLSFQLQPEQNSATTSADVFKIFITSSLLGWRNRPLRNPCHHHKTKLKKRINITAWATHSGIHISNPCGDRALLSTVKKSRGLFRWTEFKFRCSHCCYLLVWFWWKSAAILTLLVFFLEPNRLWSVRKYLHTV